MKSLGKTITDVRDNILAWFFMGFAQFMVKIQPIWDAHKILICISTGVIIGLIIGLIMGYGLFPKQWANLTPGHMRPDFRSRYLAEVAENYLITGDIEMARKSLGLNSKVKSAPWLKEDKALAADIQFAIDNARDPGIALTNQQYIALQSLQGRLPEVLATPVAETTAETGKPNPLKTLAYLVVALTLILIAFGIGWFLIIKPRRGAEPEMDLDRYEPLTGEEPGAGVPGAVGIAEPPVKSFTTTYMIGDDYFDPSFSIEIGPDFLGECGIGISETIGAGDPKKVTAFEAWLFDKSDIRTLTVVLASEYAANEPDLRAKLEPKGEVEQITPGRIVTLETSVLRVQVQIKDLEYAQGGNIPSHSYAQKITFVLQAWVKAA